MTIEDPREHWVTVREVSSFLGINRRNVYRHSQAKPGERPLLKIERGVVRLDHFQRFMRRKYPLKALMQVSDLLAMRQPQRIWCKSLHFEHAHFVLLSTGVAACAKLPNGVKLPLGGAWIPCHPDEIGRKCSRCQGHASG